LHGGPGGSTPPDLPRLFDPELWRVVCIDQRGCGDSRSADRLRDNTTNHLLADVEAVRCFLGIASWGVMGSSYGSFLGALYAARHSECVRWVLLHGVFLGSAAEVEWLFEAGGAARFYPEQWEQVHAGAQGVRNVSHFAALRLANETWKRPELLIQYYALLSDDSVPRAHPLPLPAGGAGGDDDTTAAATASALSTALAAATALTKWEDEMETLVPAPATHDPCELLAGAQIATHHFWHGCFVPLEGALPELRTARATLGAIPCAIVQGRHDVLCPPHTASALHAAWPSSTLRIVEAGAHALFEKPMRTAVQACLLQLRERSDAADGRAGGERVKRARTS
jgi:proline iminopeptidase